MVAEAGANGVRGVGPSVHRRHGLPAHGQFLPLEVRHVGHQRPRGARVCHHCLRLGITGRNPGTEETSTLTYFVDKLVGPQLMAK